MLLHLGTISVVLSSNLHKQSLGKPVGFGRQRERGKRPDCSSEYRPNAAWTEPPSCSISDKGPTCPSPARPCPLWRPSSPGDGLFFFQKQRRNGHLQSAVAVSQRSTRLPAFMPACGNYSRECYATWIGQSLWLGIDTRADGRGSSYGQPVKLLKARPQKVSSGRRQTNEAGYEKRPGICASSEY